MSKDAKMSKVSTRHLSIIQNQSVAGDWFFEDEREHRHPFLFINHRQFENTFRTFFVLSSDQYFDSDEVWYFVNPYFGFERKI